jgi:hypothetical protein
MCGRPNKSRVLFIGDRRAADEELVDVDSMNRTFIGAGVGSSHEKISGWNSDQVRSGHGFREKSQYSPESWAL